MEEGWGRIKYVAAQLIELGYKKEEILELQKPDGSKYIMPDKEFAGDAQKRRYSNQGSQGMDQLLRGLLTFTFRLLLTSTSSCNVASQRRIR